MPDWLLWVAIGILAILVSAMVVGSRQLAFERQEMANQRYVKGVVDDLLRLQSSLLDVLGGAEQSDPNTLGCYYLAYLHERWRHIRISHMEPTNRTGSHLLQGEVRRIFDLPADCDETGVTLHLVKALSSDAGHRGVEDAAKDGKLGGVGHYSYFCDYCHSQKLNSSRRSPVLA